MGAIGQGQLGAGDGCDTGRPRGSRELHGAVESVVIGDSQSSVAQIGGRPTISSGRDAPSRKENAVWRWSST